MVAAESDAVAGLSHASLDESAARSLRIRYRALITALYLATSGVSILGFVIARSRHPQGPWSRTFAMWDGAYYLRIAAAGYPSVLPTQPPGKVQIRFPGSFRAGMPTSFQAGFPPGYPFVLRLVHDVTRLSLVPSGVLVSLVCGLAATLLLQTLLESLLEPGLARRTTILFAVFPGAIVFSLVYSEGLMMLLVVACLLALTRERWLLAGVLGAAATATRSIAIALVFAGAYAAWTAWRRKREIRPLATPFLVSVGYVGYIAYQWWLTGVPRAWLIVQERGWNQHFDFGDRFLAPFLHPSLLVHPRVIARTGSLIVVLVAIWFLPRLRVPPLLAWYAFGVVIQFVVSTTVWPRPRYAMSAFPLLIIPARYFRGRIFALGVVASLVAVGVIAYRYAIPGTLGGIP
jgi:hypothetical protein